MSNIGMFDGWLEQPTQIYVKRIMKEFNIPWRARKVISECPHCRKSHWVSVDDEDGLEDYIYSIYPELDNVNENMMLTVDQYETIVANIKLDRG